MCGSLDGWHLRKMHFCSFKYSPNKPYLSYSSESKYFPVLNKHSPVLVAALGWMSSNVQGVLSQNVFRRTGSSLCSLAGTSRRLSQGSAVYLLWIMTIQEMETVSHSPAKERIERAEGKMFTLRKRKVYVWDRNWNTNAIYREEGKNVDLASQGFMR